MELTVSETNKGKQSLL